MIKVLQKEKTEKYINRFYKIVYHFSKHVCARYGRIGDDAESDANYIVKKLLDNISDFDLSRPPLAFITTVTRNFCIDELRKLNTVKKGKLSIMQNQTTDFYIDSPISPRAFVEDTLGEESIYITGYYLDNMTFEELAEVTGESVSKVKKKIGKAAQLIKDEIYNA